MAHTFTHRLTFIDFESGFFVCDEGTYGGQEASVRVFCIYSTLHSPSLRLYTHTRTHTHIFMQSY